MATGWDAKWLADHQAKMAGMKTFTAPMPDTITFSIPVLLALPNQSGGKHWAVRHKANKALAPLVSSATEQWWQHRPMDRARVTVTRYSTGADRPDTDNMIASLKGLIDLLLVPTKRHPHSFGLIVDDSPDRLVPVAQSVRVATRKEHRTEVFIERF